MSKRDYKIKVKGFETPKNHEDFINLLEEVVGDEYEMKTKFSMMNGRIRLLHKKCNKEFITTPYRFFINGEGCQICKDKISIKNVIKRKKNKVYYNHLEFVQKVYEKYNDEYVISGIYDNELAPVEIVHIKCGTNTKRIPRDILTTNILCPECNKKIKWNIKMVKKEVKESTKCEFEVISNKFETVDTPIEIRHNVCGNTFLDSFNAFMKTPKCGVCEKGMSIYEKRIKDFLLKNNIDYKREYAIDGCRYSSLLRFDFAIFKNCELVCLIEYDGKGHYFPVFNNESFVRTKRSDEIKNNFCEDNNIKLIRIPFWKSDEIEKILKTELSKYKNRK